MTDTLSLTAQIVSAFVEHNKLAGADLSTLISSVHSAMQGEPAGASTRQAENKKATKAQIANSITHDALVSFEDGRSYKMLKRHLRTLGLTPEERNGGCRPTTP